LGVHKDEAGLVAKGAEVANVNELRIGFSNTTRNPEGILSLNNRNLGRVHTIIRGSGQTNTSSELRVK
jgi:hypothetical protein